MWRYVLAATAALGLVQGDDAMTLDGIVAPGAELRQVATGFGFTEGPSWDWVEGRLVFSDIPRNRIHWVTNDGTTGILLEPSRNANGTFYDRDGNLVVCRHDARDVARLDRAGNVTILADTYDGGRFNSPNDLAITPEGTIYFTDPTYGLGDRPKEQPCQGVYRIGVNGSVTRVADDMTMPNGILVSPDGQALYVNDSVDQLVRAYPIREDGSCGPGETIASIRALAPGEQGVPDGMAMDEDGIIYCTGAGGVWVLRPDGTKLGRIGTPEPPANCAFGGPDGRTLYITARTSVYAIELVARGFFPTRGG